MHVQRVADLGGSALALTEHGNVSSWVQLEKEASTANIKPLFGLEAYCAPAQTRQKFHQTLIAATPEGLRNLNRIVGRSYAEGFYQWPTVHGNMLVEHAEGLIATSGCADSHLSCSLLGGKSLGDKRDRASAEDMRAAERVVRKYKDLFGDGYYLEVQRFPGLARARTLNPAFAEISRRTGVPLVATADVHYPFPSQNEMQKILHAAHRGGTVNQVEAGWEYDILLTYPTSDQQILEQLMATGLTKREAWSAICNTSEIASRCDVKLPRNERLRFPVPVGQTAEELVWEWLREGWRFRYDKNASLRARPEEYHERLRYEMELVVGKDFCDYFLMLSDAVRYAKDRGIVVGPARGSAAASLVCYLLRITEVDPLQFPTMVFERFLDPARTDLPDVDLDFADDRRDEVREYLVGRYGADRVANIGNVVQYKGKIALNDVARVHRIPHGPTTIIKDLILERSGGDSRAGSSLADTIDVFPAAKAAYDSHPAFKYALELEGNVRGMSVHAAGIVLSNDPISDTCAMYTRVVKGVSKTVLAYNKYDAEYLGMLKADFLGLSTAGMIGRILDMIGMTLEELYDVPLDDEPTLQAFRDGDVTGIFQFEGRATRLVNNGVIPDHFMHLADINALSRPGPLFSGMTSQYMEIKHGRAKADHLHPMVWKHTKHTYGQIIYQEQVLNIVREVGGFPVQKIGDIRRIISQKLGEASMQTMFEEFVAGAARLHNIERDLATRIWKFMVTSATYSFNVAHCISYSMLGYWAQYLKQNYPVEFFAAALAKVGDTKKAREEKRLKLLNDATKYGRNIKILPPDITRSAVSWRPEGQSIRAGFAQIPGVGPNMAPAIVAERDEHPDVYQVWPDLKLIRGIGDKKCAQMQAFAEKSDPFDINLTALVLDEIRNGLRRRHADYRGLPIPTHRSDTIPHDRECRVIWMGVVRKIEYKDLIEDERARSGDSVEEILARTKRPDLAKWCTLMSYDDGDDDVYLRTTRFNYPKFKDAIDSVVPGQDVVIAVGTKRKGWSVSLHLDALYVIDPYDDEEEEVIDD
jgi:DNA polymerase-3 subunit alpha